MSNTELKQYFLRHRGDGAAFQAYLNRINQHPLRIIARLSDPDFDDKVQAVIRQKLEAASNSRSQEYSTVWEPNGQE
ncbi:DUF6887 family protein [Limnofasciculus baicalensis]|uniref:Uncharacterized protein n=1 Tax=Limnofasciculus baicalensis BBK-W-15 TaxID=2699891 RepID=A0AAE3GP49_9CYAN|nr:hypothetical protein [Limnofasciculus baicalensis]MCP2727954.1 hypothetical protein [Limnofasciculus baicalensis BBK-W-15]